MYTVTAEHYHDDCHTRIKTLSFDSLDAVQAWMHRRSNPTSSRFTVPCAATRKSYQGIKWIRLGWLPGGFEWSIRKIEGPRGIVFSDGSLACNEPFIARTVQAMLERFWHEAKNPSTRFCDEEPQPPAARIPTDEAASLRVWLDEMKTIYADEGHTDWYDADGMAREIAESLDELLEAQGF